MSENTTLESSLLELTTELVAAFVSNNAVSAADLPSLITNVYQTLGSLDTEQEPEPEPLVPVVAVKKSITPDYIICLEDGKKLKMLKRHLNRAYGMTPEEYRERWGLPSDYPMVAPNYSKKRSSLAKDNGLGRRAS